MELEGVVSAGSKFTYCLQLSRLSGTDQWWLVTLVRYGVYGEWCSVFWCLTVLLSLSSRMRISVSSEDAADTNESEDDADWSLSEGLWASELEMVDCTLNSDVDDPESVGGWTVDGMLAVELLA